MALKFVNLHGHDGQSVYDAIGSPTDYAEWMLKNAGEDSGALAITNHGNMNSIGAMVAAQKKYDKKGAPVKFLYGVEAYYLPSILDWRETKAKIDEEKKEEKKRKKEEPESELVIENEKESKDWTQKYYNPINRRNHLVLVAINQTGLHNLYRIVSRSYREGFYRKPRVDLEMLRKFNEGIIASTACLAGVPTWCSFHPDVKEGKLDKWDIYDKELGPFMEIFGPERFFLELQFNKIPEQHTVNLDLIEYSKRSGHNLIVTADCHYPNPQMWKDREMYKMLGYQMQKNNKIDKSILEKTISELDCELYLKNGDQVYQAYQDGFRKYYENPDDKLIKEAIERTYDIAHNLCDIVAPDSSYKLPKSFHITETVKTPFDKLKELTLQGIKDKGLTKKEYIDRAVYELNVIKKLGVEEYFLTKVEIINTLKKHMLVGPGRGSGAGSLVCYLIGITMLDPIKNGLLFERFMSPSRAEMPDIDSDFELKDQALDILKENFGDENVLAISNYNRLQLRSLIKDISKLHEIPFEEVNNVTKKMEFEAKSHIMEEIGHDQKLYEFTFDKAKQYSPTLQKFIKQYPEVGEHVENLYQEVKSIGRHAGGVLIVPDAESCLPIIKIRGVDQSPIVEGITAQHLQYFGLIKFDILGLATLKIIRRCIEEILKDTTDLREPSIEDVWEFYNKHLHPDVIARADKKTFNEVYAKGNWPSIFQFAEKNVQRFCKKAKPDSVDDISAITALWRPGPLKGQADKRYLWATEPDKIRDFEKEHPIIKEVLGETRGILIYQEQFMLLAHKLAGFTLEEANKLRKLLVKPATSLAEEMKRERIEIGKKFVDGCVEKGLSKERAETLWDKEILGFISYGFNKSHSMCYAYNSYQCAWLFTHYPRQWVKACLECDPDLEKTVNVVRMLGFMVEKPDINRSVVYEWFVNKAPEEIPSCTPALTSVKGVGLTAAKELVKLRPKEGFKDIFDFFFERWEDAGEERHSWRWSKLNKKVLESLIKVEAFNSLDCVGKDKLFKNYRHMYNALFDDVERPGRGGKTVIRCALDLIKNGKMTLEEAALLADTKDWPTTEKNKFQREIVGFYDKNLLVGKFMDVFDTYDIKGVDEATDETNKKRVWGVVEKVIQKTTKTKKPYLVVTTTGMSNKPYTFRIWNTALKENSKWSEGNVLVFSLSYDENWGYNLSSADKVIKLTK